MPTWQVVIEFSADKEVVAAVEDGAVGVLPRWRSSAGNRRLVVSEYVHVNDFEALFTASRQAVEKVRAMLETSSDPISIIIYPEGEAEPVPELIGLSEIADIFGLSRQRTYQISQSGSFPQPLVLLSAGRLYSRREVENFAAQRDARAGKFVERGRPAALSHSTPDRR